LFCSLNLLFGDVLVAVAVVFCVKLLLLSGVVTDQGLTNFRSVNLSGLPHLITCR